MNKKIANIGLVGILGIIGCGNIEISYSRHNVPEACKTIANDARYFNDIHFASRHLVFDTSKCAKRAYAYDKTCTIPSEFQVLARDQNHVASQYCLWLDLEAQ